MTHIKSAIIIGGGVAGPAAALALRKAGYESTIFEAHSATADGVGGILSLAPNGLNALDVIGVDVSAIGQPIQRHVMTDGTGKQWFDFSGLPGLPASRVMPRSDLYSALHIEAVARGVRVEHGKRLIGVVESPGGISAHFEDGTSATGDLVIGADGIRSTVRTLIDPDALGPQYVGLLGLGGLAVGSGVSAPTDTMFFVSGRRAFLGYWAQPDGRVLWFSNVPSREPLGYAEARQMPAARWLDQLRDLYADDRPSRDLIAHTSADDLFVLGAMEMLPSVRRWHRGRMVLVGDAAHAPSSSSGQGASLALESSIELARCLRDLPDLATAFTAYERLRRPRVEKIAAMAAKTNGQKASGPIGKALMAALMPIAMRTFLRPEKMFGWTHAYRIDWEHKVAA